MAFIKTIPTDEAEGLLFDQYKDDQEKKGYIANFTQAFSLNPEIYEAWLKLIGAVRSKMRLRRYELVTFAAAMALECTYCMLAHGALLHKNFFNVEQIKAIVKDFRDAGLSAEEVALMTFAQKVINHPGRVEQKDIDELHGYGLTDEEILNVVTAVTARSFFSKTLEALDIQPDEIYRELEPELLQVLTIGRPFP
jgi:uncharacterized peroxidase-related enzyme